LSEWFSEGGLDVDMGRMKQMFIELWESDYWQDRGSKDSTILK